MCVLIQKLALESLHACSFPQTTYGSTSGHCMCVLSTNHTWINQWSLHVCSFSQTTHGSSSVIACVFFPQTTYGSTSGHCKCVLFTNHIWINQWSLHVCSFRKPHVNPL